MGKFHHFHQIKEVPLKEDSVVVVKVSDFNNILATLISKNNVILPDRSCATDVSVNVRIYVVGLNTVLGNISRI
jgi:5-formaminoimidazole-4-carboxamide-1-beta-D-ribofuranosyl 5'-monophosphate synthetase